MTHLAPPAQQHRGPTSPTGPAAPRANPLEHFLSFRAHSLTGGPALSAISSFSSHLFLLDADPRSPGHARTRALDGTAARPAQTSSRHVHARVGTSLGGILLNCPAPRSPEAWPARRRRVPTRPPEVQTGGMTGYLRRLSRRCGTNPGGGRNPQVPKPPTPLGFSLLSSPVSTP
jgi:hypothetical protein